MKIYIIRCRSPAKILQLNELKGKWLLTMKELQKTIMERGRILYERITGYFRGNHGDFQMSGQYAGHSGRPAASAGAAEISEFETAGIAGEIKCREQEALRRKPESDGTESETDRGEPEVAGREQEGCFVALTNRKLTNYNCTLFNQHIRY